VSHVAGGHKSRPYDGTANLPQCHFRD